MQQVPEAEFLTTSEEVGAILAEHFTGPITSPTTAALASGRARLIVRDAANDDHELAVITA